jgi:hypothetical protein
LLRLHSNPVCQIELAVIFDYPLSQLKTSFCFYNVGAALKHNRNETTKEPWQRRDRALAAYCRVSSSGTESLLYDVCRRAVGTSDQLNESCLKKRKEHHLDRFLEFRCLNIVSKEIP